MKAPWVIYANFESLVEKIHTCDPSPAESSTIKTRVHFPWGFCIMAVRSDGHTMGLYIYRGAVVARIFLYYTQLLERDIRNDLHKKASIIMTREDWKDYEKAARCHICGDSLYKKNFTDTVETYDPDTWEFAALVHRKTNNCFSTGKLTARPLRANYYTSPGLSWDGLLKHTGASLELSDVNMHLFIERGMRGSISMESRRFCKANNPYLDDYNPAEETSYIMYYDAKNLYGWALQQCLPIGDFHWCRVFPSQHQIMKWRPDRKIGYILEVDLEYPKELHESTMSTPWHPKGAGFQRRCPKRSPYQRALLGDQSEDRTEKLLLTLKDKKHYVLHYQNLRRYLERGIKLKKKFTRCSSSSRGPGWRPTSV